MREFIAITTFLLTTTAGASPQWSKEAHARLIEMAFPGERSDCIRYLKQGSEYVDRLSNQGSSTAYQHAMRAPDQTVEAARALMASFVQQEYQYALDFLMHSTRAAVSSRDPLALLTPDGRVITDPAGYYNYCYNRGIALHPVMDSTSPAHAGFAIWSLSDIFGVFKHGSFPSSIEDETALFSHPDLMQQTVGLMRTVDRIYLEFDLQTFRIE